MQFTTFDLFNMLLKEKTNTLIALFKMIEKKKEKDRKKMHCLNVSNSPYIIKNYQHIYHGVNRPMKRSDLTVINHERNK